MSLTVVVTNDDPAIKYSNGWTTHTASELISLDPIYSLIDKTVGNTVHVSAVGDGVSSSQFTFQFTGTMINVYGIITPNILAAQQPLKWGCTIDGTNGILPAAAAPLGNTTTLSICSRSELSDGNHSVAVVVNGGQSDPVIFDYLEYIPSPSQNSRSFGNIGVPANDPGIRYSDAWMPLSAPDGSFGMFTFGNFSTLSYQFSGGSTITWIAYRTTVLNIPDVRISVDGRSPAKFIPPTYVGGNILSEPGGVLFTNLELDHSVTTHTINVSYMQYGPEVGPLVLQTLIIKNGIIPGIGGAGGAAASGTAKVSGTGINTATSGTLYATATGIPGFAHASLSGTSSANAPIIGSGTTLATPAGTASSTTTVTLGPKTTPTSHSTHSLTPGIIVGIVVGSLVFTAVVSIMLYVLWMGRRPKLNLQQSPFYIPYSGVPRKGKQGVYDYNIPPSNIRKSAPGTSSNTPNEGDVSVMPPSYKSLFRT